MLEESAQLPEVGDVLKGLYRLEGLIGRGAFGVVYRAQHLDLEEAVAVKLVRPSLLHDKKLLKRFKREIQVAKGLKHPNTVRILDTSETSQGIPYYVMEYLEGMSLMELIDEEMGLSFERTRRILVQVLKALSEAHHKGVIHRDLKPENIMICDIHGEPDFVKLVDFGIAALRGSGERLTLGNAVVGTPSYMSPEQALGLEVDPRSDLYSLGLIGVECLTGEPLVTAASLVEMLTRHASHLELALPSELPRGPLMEVIGRAIRKETRDRFHSADEMIEALQALGPLSDQKFAWALDWDDDEVERPKTEDALAETLELDEPWSGTSGEGKAVGSRDSDGADVPEGLSRPRRAPWLALAAASAALVVALALAMTGGDGSGTADGAIPSLASDALDGSGGPAEASATGSIEGVAVARVAEQVATAVAAPEAAEVAAQLAACQIAEDRVLAAIPTTHLVEFSGLAGVRVLAGDELLGVTPFRALLPLVAGGFEVTLERRGYHPGTQQVAYAAERIDVALRARRDTDAVTPPAVEAADAVTPPEGLFGSAPIDRQP